MSNSKQRKQAKRKARQRAIKAAKHNAKQPVPMFGEHAMSESMKADAKDAFWKVFSTLPPQLQKEALESFQQDGGKVSTLDVKGITKILQEALEHYMHPHALCEVLEMMEKEGKYEVSESMSSYIGQIDDSVLRFITGATYIIEQFQKLESKTDEERDNALAEDDKFGDTLMATLLAFQEDSESCIQPLIDMVSEHTQELDSFADVHKATIGVTDQREYIKGLHLNRLNRLITPQE